MVTSAATSTPEQSSIPPALVKVCFVLCVINLSYFPTAYFADLWMYQADGLGVPTDFVNVWAAGRLVLEGHPALAYDWDIQKQVELALLKQDFSGYFAWHYPPPFLFVAALLAQFPYAVAFIGWIVLSIIPYLAVMRAIVGRNFGLLLAIAFPALFSNTLVGQNGFLTASLIGATLYLLPMRPVLAGVCLGLLSYKPQYGLLFPVVLIAAAMAGVFQRRGHCNLAGIRPACLRQRELAGLLPLVADVHAGFSDRRQGAVVEDAQPVRADPLFRRERTIGMGVPLDSHRLDRDRTGADVAQPCALHARGALAAGTLLTTPYLFMYDMVVLHPDAFLVRIGPGRCATASSACPRGCADHHHLHRPASQACRHADRGRPGRPPHRSMVAARAGVVAGGVRGLIRSGCPPEAVILFIPRRANPSCQQP
jgi:hypothetical protein